MSLPGAVILDTEGGPVEVHRDAEGWPTVRARGPVPAAFGLGWSVASDRRSQMDLLRRTAHGRLAEVLGPTAVAGDTLQRTLDLPGVAARCVLGLPDGQRRLLEAFAAGVAVAKASAEYEPWRPVDSIAVVQLLFQQMAGDGGELRMVEVMRRTLPADVVDFLLPDCDEFETGCDGVAPAVTDVPVPRRELAALFALPPGGGDRVVVAQQRPVGSNAWATSRGSVAVLANDMHLELTSPSVAYVARVELPDARVAGITVPGLPVVLAGANDHVAWGFTRLPGDTVDLTELDPAEVQQARTRREVIHVRGGADVTIDVRETTRGPVVGQLAGRDIAFRGTLTDPSALDFRVADLYWARDAAEAAAIVTDSGMPPVNAVIADAAGHITWTVGGRFPRREGTGPRGLTASDCPMPDSRLSPTELPRLDDPASGMVISCNNGNSLLRASGVAWNCFGGVRARRAAQVLGRAAAPDESVARALQRDVDAGYYEFYRALAVRHLGADGGPPTLRCLRDEVTAWRGTAAPDEVGLALLSVFRDVVRETLFAAATRPCQDYDQSFVYCWNAHERPLRRMIESLSASLVPPPWRDDRHFVVGHLLLARRLLTAQTGDPAPVRWGSVNGLRLTAASATLTLRASVEVPGCPESLRVAQPDFGAAMRLVVAPGRSGGGLLEVPGAAVAATRRDLAAVYRWAGDGTSSTPLRGCP
ncbi:penicillin acylase family protein [Micromonospora sp. NPDC048868]|uniref:penicillin acylase family protein n=1 Tax=Micromonospora sp. NPDC048868 TaxID=3364258 RepID=UPI00371C8F78